MALPKMRADQLLLLHGEVEQVELRRRSAVMLAHRGDDAPAALGDHAP